MFSAIILAVSSIKSPSLNSSSGASRQFPGFFALLRLKWVGEMAGAGTGAEKTGGPGNRPHFPVEITGFSILRRIK